MRYGLQAYKRATDIINDMDNYSDRPPFVSDIKYRANQIELKRLNDELYSIKLFHPDAVNLAWSNCVEAA